MEKLYFMDKRAFDTSLDAVKGLLSQHFGINDTQFAKNENGKPYLKSPMQRLFFSVSHTNERLFIAFSKENVGLDVELLSRKVNYIPIVKKFVKEEQAEILSYTDFLKHWVVKESVIKWLGGSLSQDLKAVKWIKNQVYYKETPLPLKPHVFTFDDYLICLFGERDFTCISPTPF